jgi:dynein heavy chain 1
LLLSGAAAAAAAAGTASDVALARCRLTLGAWAMDDAEARQLLALTQLPAFAALPTQMAAEAAAWAAFRAHPEPEAAVPQGWAVGPAAAGVSTAKADAAVTPERLALLTVLLVRAFRPERSLDAVEAYVRAVFGGPDRFPWRDFARVDLKTVLETDGCAGTPVMICSEVGQDASAKVDALAGHAERVLLSVAMGSAEGYADADRSIAQAAKSGAWVLLRNAHLCSEDWLGAL